VAAQQGLDLQDVIDAISSANKWATEAGLPAYSQQPAPPAPPAPAQAAPASDAED